MVLLGFRNKNLGSLTCLLLFKTVTFQSSERYYFLTITTKITKWVYKFTIKAFKNYLEIVSLKVYNWA